MMEILSAPCNFSFDGKNFGSCECCIHHNEYVAGIERGYFEEPCVTCFNQPCANDVNPPDYRRCAQCKWEYDNNFMKRLLTIYEDGV